MMWPMVFVLLVFAIFSLPLLPALVEWRARTDAQPLKVDRDYDNNVRYFSLQLRQLLSKHFPQYQGAGFTTAKSEGTFDNGVPYSVVNAQGLVALSATESATRQCRRMLLGQTLLELPEGVSYTQEIYCTGSIKSGPDATYTGLLADGDIELAQNCSVARWLHAERTVTVAAQCMLLGRVSAEGDLNLHDGVRFTRLYATSIRFGDSAPIVGHPALPSLTRLTPPEGMLDDSQGRWLIAGDLDLPECSLHEGQIVTRGNLKVGHASRIMGDLKSCGDLVIGAGAQIQGAVVSEGTLTICAGAYVQGPVVAEKAIVIESGAVIGDIDSPCTVSANEIRIESGVRCHGTVWARELGLVTDPGMRHT